MNFTWIDWTIVAALTTLMIAGVLISKTYMRSVADFLSAGRTAGRYVVCVAQGIAGLGAITVVANFEMNFEAGFAMSWWGFSMGIFILIMTVTGWVTYRFRETRALTMAQFFEMRYGQRFRVFTGIVAFVSGLLNFGIFPAVGARFFITFVGLPESFQFLGITWSTFAVSMVLLLSISIYFVFAGGQIAVIITDFIQGTFVNIVFVVIVIYFLKLITFDQVFESLSTAPVDASKINPFHTSSAKDFNLWFFLIGLAGMFYSTLSWQGTQGYNSSAKSAHEAKMGWVLTCWRGIPQGMLLLVIPIMAYVILNHPDFAGQSELINGTLNTLENDAMRSQARVPLVLTHFFPVGMMGAFAAVMLGAFITTHDSYLHSWGSIFIQDVILPLRKGSLNPKEHIFLLRLSILGVAVFIFLFSLLFQQTQYIMMFFAITAAIFAGGSGAVIIGGLYWKRGTAAGAWAAMITGAAVSVTGIVLNQIYDDFHVNGKVFWFLSMAGSALTYIVFSLLSRQKPIDMDQLLHRGKYDVSVKHHIINEAPQKGWKILGMGREFTRGDKIIYILSYAWTFIWTVSFIVGTVINLTREVTDEAWMRFWYMYIKVHLFVALFVIIWFTVGGVLDIRSMFARLSTMNRDAGDDGSVTAENQ